MFWGFTGNCQSAGPLTPALRTGSPENPGVRAAIFLANVSLSRDASNLKGRRCTLNMEALPLMSGGPEWVQENRDTADLCQPRLTETKTSASDGVRTDVDLPVEAAGSHKRRIQDVRSVGTRKHHHVGGSVESWKAVGAG